VSDTVLEPPVADDENNAGEETSASTLPRERRQRSAWLRRLVLGPLFALAVLVVLLFAMELVLRFIAPGPTAERFFAPSKETVGYGLARSVSFDHWGDGRMVHVTTDAEGRRVVPGAVDRPGVRTLHIIGDSQAFGWDLSDDESVPAQIQRRLGAGWRVVNHGVPGYGPYAYVERLAHLPAGEPAIILQTELNDLSDAVSPRSPSFARCGYLVPRNTLGSSLPCWILASYTFAKVTDLLVRLGDSRLPAPMGFNPIIRSAAAVLEYRVEKLYRTAVESRTGEVRFAVIPWDGGLVPARAAHYKPWLTHPKRIVQMPDDCGLTASFAAYPRPDELFLPNDSHLSPRGAAFAADRLVEALRRLPAG
jgi:hypothetical protein